MLAPNVSVSLVLSHADIVGQYEARNEARYTTARIASIVYCIILSLLGFILPVAEAVEHGWLAMPYGAAFAVYIYVVGTVFVIYWEINSYCTARHEPQAEQASLDGGSVTRVHFQLGNSTVGNGTAADGVGSHSNPAMTDHDPTEDDLFTVTKQHQHHKLDEHEMRCRKSQRSASGSNQQVITVWSKTAIVPTSPVRKVINQHSSHSQLRKISSHYQSPHRKVSQYLQSPSLRKISSQSSFFGDNNDLVEEVPEKRIVIDLAKLKHIFGTHESDAYLRFALLVFFAGNIIYIILEIYHYIAEVVYDCNHDRFGWTYIVRLIFTICQTLFFFRGTRARHYSQVPIIRLGLMHLIGTNLSVWFRTLVNELVHQTHKANETLNATMDESNNEVCDSLTQMLTKISPYLFPFVMEYSLIVLGMAAIMYGALDADMVDSFKNLKYVLKLSRLVSDNLDSWSIDSSKVKNSNVGAFLGGLFITLMISSLIAAAVQQGYDDLKASLTYIIADISFNITIIIACFVAFIKLLKNFPRVDRNATIDDILLIIAMTGALFFQLCVIIPTARYLMTSEEEEDSRIVLYLTLTSSVLAMIEHLFQTIVILAAMRTYSESLTTAMKYPARQTLIFLAFCNVSMWVYHTMQWQELQAIVQYEFSVFFWVFLLTLNLPFLLFFHFHSSVCYVDIWHSAYRPLAHRMEPCIVDVDAMKHENTLVPHSSVRNSSFGDSQSILP